MNRLAQQNKAVFLCLNARKLISFFLPIAVEIHAFGRELKRTAGLIPAENAKSFPLAPMAVKILFIFSFKIKRLQRIAGTHDSKK